MTTCPTCRVGNLTTGHARVTLHRDGITVIIKGVPAEVCDACGEYYLDAATSDAVSALAEKAEVQAAEQHSEVEILDFAA